MVLVTSQHIMPPWPADPNYSHFVDEKVLSETELMMIKNWVNKGCPIGDSSRIPSPPVYPTGSLVGKPDLVLRMTKPFFIKGDNQDRFMIIKFPFELPKDTFVRAIEFVPGNRRLVHHVNGHLIQYEDEKKKDVFEGSQIETFESETFRDAYKAMKALNDDGSYPLLTLSATNYLPGVFTTIYPKGIGGFKIKRKGAVFLNQIHYGPSAVDDSDYSVVNIFFSKKPPERPVRELQLGTLGISPIIPPLIIPPGEVKTFYTECRLAKDVSILTINPHMHLLGKSFLAFALSPEGDTIPLIRIKSWDFRWQYFYTFKHPVHLKAGSLIKVIGVYDNTSDNPLNPYNPPQEVRERNGSMRTTDEMFQFIISYMDFKKGDEAIDLQNYSHSEK